MSGFSSTTDGLVSETSLQPLSGPRKAAREPPREAANQFEDNPMQDALTHAVFVNLSVSAVTRHAAQLYHPTQQSAARAAHCSTPPR